MPALTASPSNGGGARRPAVPTDRCWTVPIIAACANCLFTMPETNSGLFYVLFMDKFGVNREWASWPRTISTVMSNLMGISEGTLMISTSVYMVCYFNKYRSAAMGLKYLGVSTSGIVGPLLLSALEEKYGLEGTFLVLGGITLNVLPLAVLLQNPRPIELTLRGFCRKPARKDAEPTQPAVSLTVRAPINRMNEEGEEQRLPVGQHTSSLYTVTQSSTKEDGLGIPHVASRTPGPHPQAPNGRDNHEDTDGVFLQVANILRVPIFYVLLVPFVVAEFTLPLFASTIVDYAGDKEVRMDSAALLVTCLCAGGFFGRLVVPVLSDKVPHGRCVVACVSFVLLSVCFMLMPHLRSFSAIAVVTVATGVQQGYLATIKAVLSADYLGVRSVPVCWGLVALLSLPLTFCEPSIVGVFRDTGGSYDNLYRLCGALDLMAALLLLVMACIDARRSNEKRIS
ncbi:monocarboxylate transporter 14-like isoform X2 [Amblyomma americanum]